MSVEYIKRIREKIGHDRVIMAGAGVVIYKDGKILLQKRKDNLCWAIHGGSVEIGEKVEDAAKRELFEETGLTAEKLELLGVFSGENMMYTYPNGDEVYIVGTIYVCRDFSGELLPETDETSELKWFDTHNLPDDINPPDSEPLKTFIEYIKHTK
ncbi:MAG: NUDIX hydrolase [Oscillospiraceae bacterium]|nr:NUDIX hydrolase [Oscillospiraceae bacterium]